MSKLTIFWFRRDLRLKDNHALFRALSASSHVQAIFIFDPHILNSLKVKTDARVHFIHENLKKLKSDFVDQQSDLQVHFGDPLQVFKKILGHHKVEAVYANHDYEPYARQRDENIRQFLDRRGISFHTFKDQVIFEKDEIVSKSDRPYTVYTPYKKAWLSKLNSEALKEYPSQKKLKNLNLVRSPSRMLKLEDIGFSPSERIFEIKNLKGSWLKSYGNQRDFLFLPDGTSRMGVHLRFGTVSVRTVVKTAVKASDSWLSELIWREFFMQILWNFPHVEKKSFRPAYDKIVWRKNKSDFKKWCDGNTGYPLVDAGLRELNATGHMHNRARMVTASFLCKHLLLPWSWGEKYFAEKLNDYELAANNGNWQWVAGCGCDASPYFRIFNPEIQRKKFDPDCEYIRKWVPEYGTEKYPAPIVNHQFAIIRALRTYNETLKGKRT